jgi:hypothetical protein
LILIVNILSGNITLLSYCDGTDEYHCGDKKFALGTIYNSELIENVYIYIILIYFLHITIIMEMKNHV